MSSVRQIGEIARRDFLQRAKSRVFLISTVTIVFLVLSLGPLLATATGSDPPQQIGVIGDRGAGFEEAARAAAAGFDLEVQFTRLASVADGEAALENGDLRVVLTADRELIWRSEPSQVLTAVLSSAVHTVERNATIAELGLTPEEAASLLTPDPLASRSLEEPDPEAEPRRITAMVGSILLYAAILMFGQFVMLGVLEEKSNRVVEVVLSRVRPHQILIGKVLGIGLLGLTQLVILSASVVFMLNLININGVNLAGIGLGIFLGPAMDASALSDDEAKAVGVRLGSLRITLFVLAGALTAGTVLLAGPIAFVGLICPHIARIVLGPRHGPLLIGSAMLGAALVITADTASAALNLWLGIGLMPIGIFTAIVGGPVFLWMLHPQLGRGEA